MVKFLIWQGLIDETRKETPELEIVYKKHHVLSKIIDKVAFWMNFLKVFTTVWPKFYIPDIELEKQRSPTTLQHEQVHYWDQETCFGLLKFMPKRLNTLLFINLYAIPQIFALLAIFAIWNLWWLLALGFLLPLPAPFRMIAEMRAYRRNIELGSDPDKVAKVFSNSLYYFMWPFKKHVRCMLKKGSPYQKRQSAMIRDILNRV